MTSSRNHRAAARLSALAILLCTACGPGASGGETTAAECSDGRDNDADGFVDCTDFACGAHSFCAGMTPDAGLPPSSCGPSNCGGCCSGDTCLGGNSGAACGAGGDICIDCGPDRLCSSGHCVLDPASRWNIVGQSVEVNPQTAGGGAWDAFGGAPDSFVNVYVGSETGLVGATRAAGDVFSATFDERVATGQRADALQRFLAFEVMDLDTTAHDFVGACYYSMLSDAPFDGTTQATECPRDPANDQAGFTVRWRLERN